MSGLWPQAAMAARWVAVDTVAGSGLASSLETWEAAPVDFDQDGDEDVGVGHHDHGDRLFSNDGNGSYTRVAANAWPRVNADGKIPDRHYCSWADADLSNLLDTCCAAGRGTQNLFKTPDLFVGNAPPRQASGDSCDDPTNGLRDEQDKLFLDQSGTGFIPATGFGIEGYGASRCAEVLDVNDGWDDLLICGGQPTRVFRNNQGTGFTEVTSASGVTSTHTDVQVGDLDGDGDPDLVTAMWGRIEYRRNNNGSFAAPVRVHTVPTGGGGRAVALGDADGDGDLDVCALISNLERNTNPDDALLLNTGLRFTAVTSRATGVGDAVAAVEGRATGAVSSSASMVPRAPHPYSASSCSSSSSRVNGAERRAGLPRPGSDPGHRDGSMTVIPATVALSKRGSSPAASSSPITRSTRRWGRSTPAAISAIIAG